MPKASDDMNIMSFILGNESKVMQVNKNDNKNLRTQKISKQLIFKSAMFWDNKKRVQKIKTLFLNNLGLIQFDDTQGLKIQQLQSIQLLSLSKNSLIHLHPLSSLQSLLSLNISFNKVYDLSPLSCLPHLSQLYASHNKITNIQSLSKLTQLKILILFHNNINKQKQQQTYMILGEMKMLEQIDLEQNQICNDQEYVELLRTLNWIKKINGKLNKNIHKIKQMASSKGFNLTSNNKSLVNNTSSMFYNTIHNNNNINNNQSVFLDTKSTFYNFNKKKQMNSSSHSSNNTINKIQQKQNILRKLQSTYAQIDEQFQQQIIKNVSLKSKLYQIIQQKRQFQLQKQDSLYKKQQINKLKRKVKDMKQQLFTKDKKGELLRKLFQFQIMSKKHKQSTKQNNSKQQNIISQQTQKILKNNTMHNKQIQWTRRFQADEVIVIEKNDKYLFDQQQQINDLLGNFEDTLKDIKSQIDYLS